MGLTCGWEGEVTAGRKKKHKKRGFWCTVHWDAEEKTGKNVEKRIEKVDKRVGVLSTTRPPTPRERNEASPSISLKRPG